LIQINQKSSEGEAQLCSLPLLIREELFALPTTDYSSLNSQAIVLSSLFNKFHLQPDFYWLAERWS
jgi:hypothetical protein